MTFAADWIALVGYPLAALLLLCELGSSRSERFAIWLWRFCVATGLGLGLASCTFFLRLLLGHRGAMVAAILESAALLYLNAWLIGRFLRRPRRPGRATGLSPLLAGLLTLALVAFTLEYASYTRERPHGTWDAFGIWNMRAKLMFHAAPGWTETFQGHSVMPHMDYPLLLPATVARLWRGLSSESILVPAAVGFFFSVASAALVLATLALRGKSQLGACGALILLASGHLASFGSAQRTDVPLGFFVLCACSLALLAGARPRGRAPWWTAFGLTLALAAWTKNEGALAAVLLCAPMIALVLPRTGRAGRRRAVLAFWCGALPCASVLAFFKLELAPANDLFSSERMGEIVALARAPSRYLAVAKVVQQSFQPWEHGVPLLALALAVVAVGLRGRRLKLRERAVLQSLTASLVLIAAAYASIYVVSPHELDWHVETSLERLLLHIWPSSVLLALYPFEDPSSQRRAMA